jgi:hypothetical protein
MDGYLDPIGNLYKTNLEKFGIDSKSVGWKDSESQNLRFEKLNEVFRGATSSFSVNDYGSGYGAHLSNLLESGQKVSKYNAYDISKEMLEKLSEHHKSTQFCEINSFLSDEILTQADYSLVSGTFNVMPDDNIEKWEINIRNRVLQLKEFSKIGFAFNLLTTYVDWKSEGLYYGDPLYWFDFCKREIGSNVVLYHDYNLFEWTMICKA